MATTQQSGSQKQSGRQTSGTQQSGRQGSSTQQSGRQSSGTQQSGRQGTGQRTNEDGRNSPDRASPAAVERYLKGIDFPADKNKLVATAKKNGAPSDVMNVLGNFSEKEYNSPIDVSKEMSRL